MAKPPIFAPKNRQNFGEISNKLGKNIAPNLRCWGKILHLLAFYIPLILPPNNNKAAVLQQEEEQVLRQVYPATKQIKEIIR